MQSIDDADEVPTADVGDRDGTRRRLIILLAAVSDRIRQDIRSFSPEFAERGTWGDLELLARLHFEHGGEARPSQLIGLTYTTSAGVTGSLRRLEDEGLIVRVRIEGDRRVLMARVTDTGRTALEASLPPFNVFVEKRVGDLSNEEIDWLTAFIERQMEI